MCQERGSIYANCVSCDQYQKHVFAYRSFPRGVFVPREKCPQNRIYFVLEGEVWVNSDEHPDTILRAGQFIFQPVGSRIEYRVHTPTESILYSFDRIQNVCEERVKSGLGCLEGAFPAPKVMTACSALRTFLDSMKMYLADDLLCAGFLQAKRPELFYLLNCYYPIRELTEFYSSIYSYTKSFRYFVLNNYHKVRDVEEFAELGGYTVPTFRRIFKETFDEPVYQWMLKHRCQDIRNDLITSDMSISQISTKYGFESLANFRIFVKLILVNLPEDSGLNRKQKEKSHETKNNYFPDPSSLRF